MSDRVMNIVWSVFFLAFLMLGLLLLGSLSPVVGGYRIWIVESGSMSPTIPLGAAIVVQPKDSYVIDDVITYQRQEDSEVTTHRIIEEKKVDGDIEFVVKGDANNTPDMRTVALNEIVGSVQLSIPYLGFVLDFARQPIGFLLLIGVPAALVMREQWQKIRKEVGKHRPENNES